MTTTFGEIDWSEGGGSGGKRESAKDLFLKLDKSKEGNDLRIVAKPMQYLVHQVKEESDKQYGTRIRCTGNKDNCPLCLAGNKAKPRWYLIAINRKANKIQILDTGYGLYSQIKKYAQAPKWGDPTKYEITITVHPEDGPSGYYMVMPYEKRPLTPEDMKLVDSFDKEAIEQRCIPLTPEQVSSYHKTYQDKVNGVTATKTVTGSTAAQASATPSPAPAMISDDDDEFPSAEV